MRKFILKIICLLINIPLILTYLIIININIKNANQDNYYFAIIDKTQRLQDTYNSDKRIIFFGGSNLALGLDSEKIQNEFNIPVVNMGLHAGYGFFHAINDSIPYIHQNDIIILCPEYSQISKSGNGNYSTWAIELVVNKKNIWDLHKRNFYDFPSEFFYFIKYLIKIGLNPLYFNDAVYRRSGFNKYGDSILHLEGEFNIPEEMFTINANVPLNLKYYKYFENAVNEFKKKHAVVIFNYPICHEATFNANIDSITEIDDYLRQHLDVLFAGTKEEYVCQRDMLFDTPYHANKQGREWRTNLVIKHLHECYFDRQEK